MVVSSSVGAPMLQGKSVSRCQGTRSHGKSSQSLPPQGPTMPVLFSGENCICWEGEAQTAPRFGPRPLDGLPPNLSHWLMAKKFLLMAAAHKFLQTNFFLLADEAAPPVLFYTTQIQTSGRGWGTCRKGGQAMGAPAILVRNPGKKANCEFWWLGDGLEVTSPLLRCLIQS